MRLNEISDNPRAFFNRKIVGRGRSSGLGKTCGKGTKGQKSRSGVSLLGFEGGQNPIYRRVPKRGFNKKKDVSYLELSMRRLQSIIDFNGIKPNSVLDEIFFRKLKVLKKRFLGIKLLAGGNLVTPVTLKISKASKKSFRLFKKLNGELITSIL